MEQRLPVTRSNIQESAAAFNTDPNVQECIDILKSIHEFEAGQNDTGNRVGQGSLERESKIQDFMKL